MQAFRSPLRDLDHVREIPLMLRPLELRLPLQIPHMPPGMCYEQDAGGQEAQQPLSLSYRNPRPRLKDWNHNLHVLDLLFGRISLKQHCVQNSSDERERLRGSQV
ncbi:hypothetical protein NDU88_005262 [Pleurodeles waltl]|uniref:Uncharacterized protein n=1 Tax=Pleurodeles waltl TaxID=8319 RepID=A0AAV7WAJ3_PLEWA|nr:hypothetical protein NDU88_005262 [Pleurodeles waltl]